MNSTLFSVLMSVYAKETPQYLEEALHSVFNQTLPPTQVVLVKDGPLTTELDTTVAKFADEHKNLVTVPLEKNVGLGNALNEGLKHCSYDIVIRMDSDDICLPHRFKKQIEYIDANNDIVLLSGYIDEFEVDHRIIKSRRIVPIAQKDIVARLKSRNAFNHVAVCFRKSAIEAVGGYVNVPYFEDYDLWVRVVQAGNKVANLPEVLVLVRIGNDMIGRRHGWQYSKLEYNFLKRQLDRRFITKKEFVFLLASRIPVRLLPKCILSLVYRLLRH